MTLRAEIQYSDIFSDKIQNMQFTVIVRSFMQQDNDPNHLANTINDLFRMKKKKRNVLDGMSITRRYSN